jgi:hypothetical protein
LYDVCTDTKQTSQRESLIGSRELNRYTGDGAGPENKLTVSLILLNNRMLTATLNFILIKNKHILKGN